MLRLADDWLWDSWIVHDGEAYHAFFLQAPRSLGNPDLRHLHASVGHAVSTDLVDWTYLGRVFAPEPGGWDDMSIWTGSVTRGDDGRWRLFYTALGTQRGHGADDQRIGVAVSDDLSTWTRVTDRPIVEVDPRWYRTLPGDATASATWRDPFVFRDPDGDGWRMIVTARARDAEPGNDGVLAEARSADMLHWEVGPAVSEPGTGFSQLEVSQVHLVGGTPVLSFTGHPIEQTADHIARFGGRFCTWSVAGTSLAGPWDVAAAQPLRADPILFAAPLVQLPDGGSAYLGFHNHADERDSGFVLCDPVRVELIDGGLQALG